MENQELEEKHVVTSFVRHNGKILILKRSDKVGSFQGKWAGVSGYVEHYDSELIERAKQEIKEETGIEDVTLVKEGEHVRNGRPDLGVCFVVHPFLFESDTDAVVLDWEHTEYAWIDPEELENYDTVPRLGEGLGNVLLY